MSALSQDARIRYQRQLVIPQLGEAAQEKLRKGRVLVVGAGGLGSPCLLYLAAAGVGHLGVLDSDVVELSNLQRQIVHFTTDLGRRKTDSAADKLEALNPEVQVTKHFIALGPETVDEVLDRYDIVVAAVDNLHTRFLVNERCVVNSKILIEGSVQDFAGRVMTIRGGETACYECIFPKPTHAAAPGDKGEVIGVLGPVPGVIGCIQAGEAIKLIAGVGRPLFDRVLYFDAFEMTFEEIAVSREPMCPACGGLSKE